MKKKGIAKRRKAKAKSMKRRKQRNHAHQLAFLKRIQENLINEGLREAANRLEKKEELARTRIYDFNAFASTELGTLTLLEIELKLKRKLLLLRKKSKIITKQISELGEKPSKTGNNPALEESLQSFKWNKHSAGLRIKEISNSIESLKVNMYLQLIKNDFEGAKRIYVGIKKMRKRVREFEKELLKLT
ncbi:hypothetical protein KKG83_02760 [Candidatus Micrarchaeota archaeon]|nr:hypothetical protein [Candidatus Micrarchaeota archaeon]MBU2476366.1 hypothetical protein [Candidatus Micrarchaeota archaeon]